MVFVELGHGDELGVLHVHQILGIEAVGGEFAVAEHADLPGRIARVGHLKPPDLVGRVHGHVVQGLGFDAVIGGFDLRIAGAVAGDGFKCFQRLFHRPPGGGPEIARFLVPQIDVAARLVELVEHIAQDAPRRAGLDEAVAPGVLGHDGAVIRRTQIVGPGHGRAGVGDHVFPAGVIKITVLHGKSLLSFVSESYQIPYSARKRFVLHAQLCSCTIFFCAYIYLSASSSRLLIVVLLISPV